MHPDVQATVLMYNMDAESVERRFHGEHAAATHRVALLEDRYLSQLKLLSSARYDDETRVLALENQVTEQFEGLRRSIREMNAMLLELHSIVHRNTLLLRKLTVDPTRGRTAYDMLAQISNIMSGKQVRYMLSAINYLPAIWQLWHRFGCASFTPAAAIDWSQFACEWDSIDASRNVSDKEMEDLVSAISTWR